MERVHSGFSKRLRESIPIEQVREVLSRLDLTKQYRVERVPRLRVHHLRFTGTKPFESHGFTYDQEFQPGVNVVFAPDNGAGKSTILNTIKFALTGDDGDYDKDVSGWIERVWLHFFLDQSRFTVHIDRLADGSFAYLATGHLFHGIDEVSSAEGVIDVLQSLDELQESLQRFFFRRFGLDQLSWTQQGAVRNTSWRTYFQALHIPANSEDYLLVYTKHAMGGQDGLILSMLLGLSFAKPLNDLLIHRRETEGEVTVSDEERERAEAQIAALKEDLAGRESRLRRLAAAQQSRRKRFEANPSAQRLVDIRAQQTRISAEVEGLEARHRELTTEIQRKNAQARNLREAVALRLHFSGLEVRLCPNCDSGVTDSDVERERTEHQCRLCGKEAETASAEDLEAMQLQADDHEARAERDSSLREDIGRTLARTRSELARLGEEALTLRIMFEEGLNYILPTSAEEEERSEHEREIGRINARISSAQHVLEQYQRGVDAVEVKLKIQKRARDVLKAEASQANESRLSYLAGETERLSQIFGAESISNVTCSALGSMALEKHGAKVSFGSIKNAGEKLRVKLAFFLGMMRLGRRKDGGRHPGFLMIDQPGSDEIVVEDLLAMAEVLKEIDADLADELQIICFTARTELDAATVATKIFRPTLGTKFF